MRSRTPLLVALWAGVLTLVATSATLAPAARAGVLDAGRFAVGVTGGSDGLGADATYSASPWLVVRARATWLQFDYSGYSGALLYSGRFKLSQAGGYLDLHPFSNAFALSAGVASGARRVDLSASARSTLTYRGLLITPAQAGLITGHAQLSNPAPFVGLGYDDTFTARRRFGFKFLVGAEFSHAPNVTLTPQSGLVTQYADLLNLPKLANDIRRDGRIFEAYPAISAGATFKF